MQIPQRGIAFFDSGIGGLTVLATCRDKLPNTPFYYYGDNLRAPYGNLSEKNILKYTEQAFSLFEGLNVQAAVIACNTVTAVCVERLRSHYSFPIIGAEPAVLPAAAQGGETFVLCTHATRASARFIKLCETAHRKYPQTKITCPPCDSLAGVIEKNILTPNFDYQPYLPKGNPDSVVLGCTHYVYVKKIIEEFYNCPAVDGNEGIAHRLIDVLRKNNRATQPLVTPPPIQTLHPTQNPVLCHRENTAQLAPVYFLGSGKTQNYTVFKQMFGNSGKQRG